MDFPDTVLSPAVVSPSDLEEHTATTLLQLQAAPTPL